MHHLPAQPQINLANPLSRGLIACWPFHNRFSRVEDITDNAAHGTVTLGAGTWPASPIGWALDFDGADTLVDCGSPAHLDTFMDSNFTFSCWLNVDSTGEGSLGRIWNKGSANVRYFRTSGTNQLRYNLDYTGGGSADLIVSTSDNVYTLGTTFQAVLTGDGSATAANHKVWVNGKETGYTTQQNGTGTRPSETTSNFILGNRAAADTTIDGRMWLVKIWNRQLSAAEIMEDYISPLALFRPLAVRNFGFVAPAPAGWGPLLGESRNRLVIAA